VNKQAVTETGQPQTKPTREWVLKGLQEIMEIALERVANAKTPNADRIKWSRVVISAGQGCNSVLRDVELETLKQQIMELKAIAAERSEEGEGKDAINQETD